MRRGEGHTDIMLAVFVGGVCLVLLDVIRKSKIKKSKRCLRIIQFICHSGIDFVVLTRSFAKCGNGVTYSFFDCLFTMLC